MNKLPGVNEVFGWVSTLKTLVQEFAQKESRAIQDFQGKLTATEQRRSLENQQAAGLRDDLIHQAAERLRLGKTAAQARHAARIPRIRDAYKASIKDQSRRLEEYEGSRKYTLQMDVMQSKKSRETALKEADQSRDTFIKEAEEETEKKLEVAIEKARGTLKAYPGLLKPLAAELPPPEAQPKENEHAQRQRLLSNLDKAAEVGRQIRSKPLPAIMRLLPVWIVIWLLLPALYWVLPHAGVNGVGWPQMGGIMGGSLVVGIILLLVSKSQVAGLGRSLVQLLVEARQLQQASIAQAHGRHAQTHAQIEAEYQQRSTEIENAWTNAMSEAEAWKGSIQQDLAEQEVRCLARNDAWLKRRESELQRHHDAEVAAALQAYQASQSQSSESAGSKESRHRSDWDLVQRQLEQDWTSSIRPLWNQMDQSVHQSSALFPIWSSYRAQPWQAPVDFPEAVPLGHLEVQIPVLAGKIPSSPFLALPGASRLELPLQLVFPNHGSVLLESDDSGRAAALSALNSGMLRLLTAAPPGRVQFTVIDPVGLGENFAAITHLADYAEHVINHKIWTQSDQIDDKLADLNDHIEKVIQMYLRSDYATIADYNRQAGNIAEKYHFLVIADFPQNFSDTGLKRLMSIIHTGARCGVYTWIHWNTRLTPAAEFGLEELRKSSLVLTRRGPNWVIPNQPLPGTQIHLGTPPESDLFTDLIHRVGKASRDSNRVQVPFSHIAPAGNALWTNTTTDELRVSIGRTGATKLQYLAIGKGTRQHALLAGKTGSGKSTLLHVVVTNLALWCSPDEVEFYLVDFKKGVEFKCYAEHQLPHAKVVAIESDREFGLSVLQKVDQELRRRGELFRQAGVQDIPGYKRGGGTEPMPRVLLVVDEFQELFTEDDKISQNASVLLDRIVRQGRAFGIHVLLGSQTLGGAYTVARTTLGQMVIRIALQCNEADSYLIMDENNAAPRLLSRPGEGIYNDAAGASEGNSPFQVVWLSDSERDQWLEKVRAKARESGGKVATPFVFEGDAAASLSENEILRSLRLTTPEKSPSSGRIWLGAPNSIKGPTEVVFERQSGNHLLMIGQRDESMLALMTCGLLSLAAQYPAQSTRFVVVDASAPDSLEQETLKRIRDSIPQTMTMLSPGNLAEGFAELGEELARRTSEENSDARNFPPIYVFVLGMQRFKKLKAEDDFGFSSSSDDGGSANPAALLGKLVQEGSSVGIHLIVSLDTYNNLGRFMSRKLVTEFEMRVLFQMSANDSASLMDSPRASTLGMHKAVFYHEKEGTIEVFRPYALPSPEFIQATRA